MILESNTPLIHKRFIEQNSNNNDDYNSTLGFDFLILLVETRLKGNLEINQINNEIIFNLTFPIITE
jgi:hypothetical protein